MIYDLCAVVHHSGGLHSGHYTSTARNHVDGKWYSFNGNNFNEFTDAVDNFVSGVERTQTLTASAYLLLYQRQREVREQLEGETSA